MTTLVEDLTPMKQGLSIPAEIPTAIRRDWRWAKGE